MYKNLLILLYIFYLFNIAGSSDINSNDSISFKPNIKPSLVIPRLSSGITIDGIISEEAWQNAAIANNFSETDPGDLVKPPVDTQVFLTYDDSHLYIAFKCFDDPEKIRASMRDRDNIWSDDYVGILLDTYGNASWAYYLFSNPLGIQADERFSSSHGEDESFDVIFFTEGRITNSGYEVEMAIPFSSLRFPQKDKQDWKVTFWRNHPRDSRRRYTWAGISRDDPCFLCQYGTISGIKNVMPGEPLEILPAIVGSQSGNLQDFDDPASHFENENIQGEASLSLKWAPNPGLTIEGTLNPDFSQVESDAAQIDVNQTFALSYPEKRPFFQEGSDLFQTWYNVVYTRSINDPLAATKIIGRWQNSTLAYLGAVDENTPIVIPFEEFSRFAGLGKSYSNIFRFKQTFGNENYIGAILTDRRLESDGTGTVFGADGIFRFLDVYRFEWQLLSSFTREPNDTLLTSDFNDERFYKNKFSSGFDGEKFWGNAVYTSLERNARHWNFDIDYRQTSPTFRADNGFITGNNNRRVIFWSGYQTYPTTKILDRFTPYFSVGRVWNFNGTIKDQWFQPGLNFRFKKQTTFEISYLFNMERFNNIIFPDINRLEIYVNSSFSDPVSLGFWMRTGRSIARSDLTKGEGTELEMWGTIKLFQRLIIEPAIAYSVLDRIDNGKNIFDGYIFRSRFNYQFTRELFLRMIVQYNNFSENLAIEPLLSYKLNPFTIFYIGSTHDYFNFPNNKGWIQTQRQFFMKFQYLVQL